jgi:predicted membrane protein
MKSVSFLKRHKSLTITFAIVFLVSWVLGVLRFDYDWALLLNNILLFPFGFLFVMNDGYWWSHFGSSHLMNDEFVGLFSFLFSVTAQTFVYFGIYKMIAKRHVV